jgi:glc operon protein GlcG
MSGTRKKVRTFFGAERANGRHQIYTLVFFATASAFTQPSERTPVMHTKAVLTLSDVTQILAAARAEAQKHQWPVSIAIVDDGGHPLALERLDNCAPISAYIAIEKARTAALGRRDSKAYEDMINGGRTAFLSVPILSGTLEGGVPLVVDGQVIGAIGVSGVKAAEDAQIARAGVAGIPA